MKRVQRTLINSLLPCGLLTFALCSCEYEFRDDPVAVSRGNVPDASPNQERQAVEEKKPAEVSGDRPVLKPGKDVSGAMAVPAKAKKLNLPELIETGVVTLKTNVSGLGDANLAADEIETTLSKSNGVNPFRFSFEFSNDRLIKAVRVLSTYSDYSLAIETDKGDRFVVDMIIEGEWSTVSWPEGLKTKKLSVEVLRKVRDNYVHVNEIELFE
jgi:hypothetical protein